MGLFGSFFSTKSSLNISIHLEDEHRREHYCSPSIQSDSLVSSSDAELQCTYPVFHSGDTIRGKVIVKRSDQMQDLSLTSFDHQGIKIEFIGLIEMPLEYGGKREFRNMVCALAGPGAPLWDQEARHASFEFSFALIDAPYESYLGRACKVRYLLRATLSKRLTDESVEKDLWVLPSPNCCSLPQAILDEPVVTDICLGEAISFQISLPRRVYKLQDVLHGWIWIKTMWIHLKSIELNLIRREYGHDNLPLTDAQDLLFKTQIADGDVHEGEKFPFRVFLSDLFIPSLGPSMDEIGKIFSVRYLLHMVLMDEYGRRYYKQIEIKLFRDELKKEKPVGRLDERLHREVIKHLPQILCLTKKPS